MNKSWEELRLPPGYTLELDLDMLVLRRPDGSAVAAFSSRGATPEHVEAAAWEAAVLGQDQGVPRAPDEPPRPD